MNYNDVTFLVSVFFLPAWLIWELFIVLWLRPRGVEVDGHLAGTISMIMRQRAYQFACIPFFWASMMAHWWINWYRPVWDSNIPAITFWLILVGVLVWDVVLYNIGVGYSSLGGVTKFLRAPPMMCLQGFLAGYILFPQPALRGAGMRWW